jgi:hypothetical protein
MEPLTCMWAVQGDRDSRDMLLGDTHANRFLKLSLLIVLTNHTVKSFPPTMKTLLLLHTSPLHGLPLQGSQVHRNMVVLGS